MYKPRGYNYGYNIPIINIILENNGADNWKCYKRGISSKEEKLKLKTSESVILQITNSTTPSATTG